MFVFSVYGRFAVGTLNGKTIFVLFYHDFHFIQPGLIKHFYPLVHRALFLVLRRSVLFHGFTQIEKSFPERISLGIVREVFVQGHTYIFVKETPENIFVHADDDIFNCVLMQ